MDPYTRDTKEWLELRYKLCDEVTGICFAHQNIYGFRKGFNEGHDIHKYMCTYGIIDALSRLNFNTLLDVGGSEGYKAHVIRQIYNARVSPINS